ncbi:unnamed protein product, partial [Effrenium voratum]
GGPLPCRATFPFAHSRLRPSCRMDLGRLFASDRVSGAAAAGSDQKSSRRSSKSLQPGRAFADIPSEPQKVYPKILECLGDDPVQDCDLQAVEDDSEELAKLMDESGSSSSNNEKLPVNVVHPSRGSEKHHSGTCQPCSFFLRGKCTVAEGCLYCHYEHDRPQRPGKKSRERAKRRQGRAVGEAEAEAETKSFQGSSHGFGSLMDLQRACGGRTAVLANFQAPVSPARAVYTSTAPAPDDEPDLPPLAPGVIRL